ncbi:hypothetical protein HJG60_010601 [Phyllostomus discolor]|uniref:Uncharacterized protein n=1 Tax=Phyllostomus discolor TaxID=89673 RepID=A0A834EEY0_9CHIR|nr:hypothetical protein HJG60_010601 [Phyllostomus discolor]
MVTPCSWQHPQLLQNLLSSWQLPSGSVPKVLLPVLIGLIHLIKTALMTRTDLKFSFKEPFLLLLPHPPHPRACGVCLHSEQVYQMTALCQVFPSNSPFWQNPDDLSVTLSNEQKNETRHASHLESDRL